MLGDNRSLKYFKKTNQSKYLFQPQWMETRKTKTNKQTKNKKKVENSQIGGNLKNDPEQPVGQRRNQKGNQKIS